ncbi:hypothetical protein HAX54_001230 [Datura stramonium]|uniref:SET domain-containing protein n=1 Tax=Datura stramonium TaxID=4076 RepID=A0ABS8T446_DATST|nr:hypothetical protein [Datura stramonium]
MSYRHKKLRRIIAICECKYNACDPESACGQRCLNVLTSIECTIGCVIMRFQKCEYAKTKLFRTEGRGWGLLADEEYKEKFRIEPIEFELSVEYMEGLYAAGQFIIECCGEVISSEEAKRRSQSYEARELKDAYIISLEANYFIDSTRKGNFGRFINHSCWPNCETRKWKVSGETRCNSRCLLLELQTVLFLGAKSQRFRSTAMSGKMGMTSVLPTLFVADFLSSVNCDLLPDTIQTSSMSRAALPYSFPISFVHQQGLILVQWIDRYMVEDVPLYDSAEDEPFLVISGTSGGNEHTRILNDSEGSMFKLGQK